MDIEAIRKKLKELVNLEASYGISGLVISRTEAQALLEYMAAKDKEIEELKKQSQIDGGRISVLINDIDKLNKEVSFYRKNYG